MKRLIESCLSNESGNSVLGALVNILYSTLLTLSVLSLAMSAYNTLLIRDAAIEAAARAALPEAPSQLPYLRKLIEGRLPMLARFDVEQVEEQGLVGFRIKSFYPTLGLVEIAAATSEVLVAKEKLPLK